MAAPTKSTNPMHNHKACLRTKKCRSPWLSRANAPVLCSMTIPTVSRLTIEMIKMYAVRRGMKNCLGYWDLAGTLSTWPI